MSGRPVCTLSGQLHAGELPFTSSQVKEVQSFQVKEVQAGKETTTPANWKLARRLKEL